MTSADIAFITVQFGNPGDTSALVKSLASLDGAERIELIVVDNAKRDTNAKAAADDTSGLPFPVQYLATKTNLYYWGGAAFALDALRADGRILPRWVVICNNDVTIADPKFLTILSELEPVTHPIIAPSIVSTVSGREQNPLLETPPAALKRLKWRIYDTHFHIARGMLRIHAATRKLLARQSGGAPRPRNTKERVVYAPHGAFVILSSQFFEQGGTLDTTVPMFAEEITLAEAANKLGMAIRYVSKLKVNHAEHSTTGQGLTRQKYEMERAARLRYYALVNENRRGTQH